LLLFSLLGCEKPTPNPAQIEKTRVLASVYALADIVRQVGGPFVDESWIVESGQSLAGVQSTPDLRARAAGAQLVISNGEADAWASEALTNPLQRQRIVRLDLLASAKQIPVQGFLWLDPVLVKDLAREISGRLLMTHSDRETYFNERAEEFCSQLDAILNEFQPKLRELRNRKILVTSTDYNPLLYRFGLEAIQPLEADPISLTDSHIAILKRVSKERGTTLLLLRADLPAVVLQDLSFRTGLQMVTVDALGSSGQGGRDYLTLMRFNLEQLLHAASFQ
jgi:zinc transport system substrate-binding protein